MESLRKGKKLKPEELTLVKNCKLNPEVIERTKQLQYQILKEYSEMLRVNGTLVYSTCSILPSENKKQVETFISENQNFELVKEKNIFPSEGFDGFYMAELKRII